MRLPIVISRSFLGIIFIITGLLKGVDPYGTTLKMAEYLSILEPHNIPHLSTILSISLISVEIFLGLGLVFGVAKRVVALTTLLSLVFFTLLTAIIAFNPYVGIDNCGCFGSALDLTNIETFIKNIFLLIVSAIYLIIVWRCKPQASHREILLVIYLLIFSVAIPIYSLINLPPFDFLPYNRGDRLQDTDLKLYDTNFVEVRDSLLEQSSQPILFVVSHKKLHQIEITEINNIEKSVKDRYKTVLLSSNIDRQNLNNITQYYVDETTLKSMIRADYGVVLIDNGIIIGKWRLSTYNIKKSYSQRYLLLLYWAILLCGVLVAIAIKYKLFKLRSCYE